MSEDQHTPWRGRLRLSSPSRDIPRDEIPLSEAERDSLEGWMPKGVHILMHIRGALTREGRSLWALTSEGVLITTLIDDAKGRVRARAHWVASSQLRRLDLLSEGGKSLIRLATPSRGFVLYDINEDRATRFVVLARAAIIAEPRLRKMSRLGVCA